MGITVSAGELKKGMGVNFVGQKGIARKLLRIESGNGGTFHLDFLYFLVLFLKLMKLAFSI